jgi:hypothetical protein
LTAAGNAGGSGPWRRLGGSSSSWRWSARDRLRWGIADQASLAGRPRRSRSRATRRAPIEARLERFAQRGESDEVATTAAGLIGDDVPGADLLSDVTVRPSPRGGSLTITATADAPDVAAAAADGFQRALVEVEGDPLALGKAASIPAEPYEDRSPRSGPASGSSRGSSRG